MKINFWVLEKRGGQVPSSNFNYLRQLCWLLTFVFWGRLVHFHVEGPNFCHLVVFAAFAGTWKCVLSPFKVIICLRCFTLRCKWLLSERKQVVVISVMTCEWWVANCSVGRNFGALTCAIWHPEQHPMYEPLVFRAFVSYVGYSFSLKFWIGNLHQAMTFYYTPQTSLLFP